MTRDLPADPALKQALEQATGGDLGEASELRALEVRHARDLTGIEACVGLETLDLFACELSDLQALAPLRGLRALSVRFSQLGDASALAQLPGLARVDLSFSTVTDPRYLLENPALKRLILIGCPLSPEAWATLSAMPAGGPVVQLSAARDWKLYRKFWGAGTSALFSFYHGRWLFARPGIPADPERAVDVVVGKDCGTIEFLSRGLKGPPELMVPQLATLVKQAPVSDPAQDAPIEEGDAEDAARWVRAAGLPTELERALLSLVGGFPDLRWFRRTPATLALQQARLGVTLPDWYVKMHGAVVGVEPQQASWVWLGAGGPALHKGWYFLDISASLAKAHPAMLGTHHLLPIAEHLGAPEQALAIKVDDPVDSGVYVVLLDDGDTRLAPDPIVFDHYTSLLENIAKIRLESGLIVERQRK